MRKLAAGLLAGMTFMAAAPVMAQPHTSSTPPPPMLPSRFVDATVGTFRPNPADVASIDAIMAAVYDVISGPAGQRRDWDRMRSLFTVDARLMPKGSRGLRIGSVEDYITVNGGSLERDGFFEREVARRVEQYGDIAHVFSTYEARRTADGPVFMRGINSFQLVRHDGRWWVVSIMWQAETPQTPIPQNYLPITPSGERG